MDYCGPYTHDTACAIPYDYYYGSLIWVVHLSPLRRLGLLRSGSAAL